MSGTGRSCQHPYEPGTVIKVVRNIKGGPKIIDVLGGRISLGHSLAMRVCVRPLGNE